MGHIANLILDSSADVVSSVYLPPASPTTNKITAFSQTTDLTGANGLEFMTETYVWRMHQSNKNKHPIKKQNSSNELQVNLNEEQKSEETVSISSLPSSFHSKLLSLDKERPASTLSSVLRMKIKEPITNRRRKISVPEIGPMTTVQELAMDSPTIPGRPPIHERSQSVPVSTNRKKLGENAISFLSGPVPDEKAEIMEQKTFNDENQEETLQNTTDSMPVKPILDSSAASQPPISVPVIHTEQGSLVQQPSRFPLLKPKIPKVNINTDSQPPEVPPKQPKALQESQSSAPKSLPFIPISSWSSAFSATFSVSTPTTSPLSEGRFSPKPWSFGRSSPKTWSIPSRSSPKSSPTSSTSSLKLHSQKSETSLLSEAGKLGSNRGHVRHSSEDISELKSDDRGSYEQRSNVNVASKENQPTNQTSDSPLESTSNSTNHDRNSDLTDSSCSLPESQCFLSLPSGHPPSSVSQNLSPTELSHLQNQALSQAFRFEVLSSRDVASLSKELRALDERCEFLRKTHHSLRNDRQSLHARLCSNLRNQRVGRFSCEVLLKLEVNLSELDRCIDACVSKFELAENRRMRLRQKLLEHVAAAAVVEIQNPADSKMQSKKRMHQDTSGENTPPRSPQHEPQRTELEIKGLPSHLDPIPSPIPEPLLLLTPRTHESSPESPTEISKEPLEQIIIIRDTKSDILVQSPQDAYDYADKDVFALMDCVEEEMERMGM